MERFALHNADRACACPGSLQLTPRVKLEPDPARLEKQREGREADRCIAALFNGLSVAEFPEDMQEHCRGYYEHIVATLTAAGVPRSKITALHAEAPVTLKWLTEDRKDIPVIEGRPDYQFYACDTDTLYVWDFKYGHRPVEAVGSGQLAGAAISDAVYRRQIKRVEAFIYQPRDYTGAGPVKHWSFDRDEILRQNQRFRTARLESVMPDAPLRTGKHCRDCDASGICPALWEDISMAKTVLDAPASATPVEVGERLALALQLNEQSGYLKDNLTAQGIHMVKAGSTVPGFKVVRGITQRRIKDAEQLIAIAPLYGLTDDDVTERKPKALGKLEKAFGSELIDEFTVKPEGRLELVPEADKRPTAIHTSVETAFSTPVNHGDN